MGRLEALRWCRAQLLLPDGYLGAGFDQVLIAFGEVKDGMWESPAYLAQGATTLWPGNPAGYGAALKLADTLIEPPMSWAIGRGRTRPDEEPYGVLVFATEAGDGDPIVAVEGADLRTVIVRAVVDALIWREIGVQVVERAIMEPDPTLSPRPFEGLETVVVDDGPPGYVMREGRDGDVTVHTVTAPDGTTFVCARENRAAAARFHVEHGAWPQGAPLLDAIERLAGPDPDRREANPEADQSIPNFLRRLM